MSIKTVCGNIVNELKLTRKQVFSVKDLADAIRKVGPTSTGGVDNYLGNDGNLTRGGYITRCKGGWELTNESKKSGVIMIKVTPNQNTAEVFNAVGVATKRFGSVVELRMEV